MKFTVRDALNIEQLQGAKVVGGWGGLEREVRFVNIMEVPDVKRWMKGGEFLVTAGFAFQEVPDLVDTILDELEAVGVSAFGIKLGTYLHEMPAQLIEHANRLNLPLIELPPNIPYMDFMLPIYENLMMRQYSILKRVEQTHEQLIDLALQGEGISGICLTLEKILPMPIMVFDKYGNCLSQPQNLPQNLRETTRWYEELMQFIRKTQGHVLQIQNLWNVLPFGEEESLNVIPIEINGSISSYLVVFEKQEVLDEISKRALEHAATVMALVIVKERAVFESQQQIRAELMDELISRHYKNAENIIKRAEFCDLNIQENLAVFVLDIDDFEEYIEKKQIKDEEQVQKLKQDVMNTTRFILSNYLGHTPLLSSRSDNIIGIVPYDDEEKEEVRSVFESIRQEIQTKNKGLEVTIGIGRTRKGIDGLKESYEEAEQAVKILRLVTGNSKVAFLEEQGAYCVLSELKNSAPLGRYYAETIGRIEVYDHQNKTELLQTLEQYFKCGQNVRKTSEAMYLHRNSITYRIKKIEEISGRKLDSSDDNFEIQLALLLRHLIDSKA